MINNNKTTKQTKTTTPRAKKLTLAKIQKEHKKLNAMSTHPYDTESNTQIKYYEKFSESKIDELMQEVFEAMQQDEKLGTDFFKEEVNFIRYIQLKIIDKFSELGNEIPNKFSDQVNIMDQMYELGILDRLITEMFDQGEVEKVFDKIDERAGILNKLNDALLKEMNKLDRLENKDILGQPFNVLAVPPTGLIQ